MQHDMIWRTLDADSVSIEHLHFKSAEDGSKEAHGHIIGVVEDNAVSVAYTISLDRLWCVREVQVNDLLSKNMITHLYSNGQGDWHSADGTPLPDLSGCIDVDFTLTPFTNTLPIRRLVWQVNTRHEIDVVYIVYPHLQVYLAKQTYTCRAMYEKGAQYHFEMDDFKRDISVDTYGFVINYPELFKREWVKRS